MATKAKSKSKSKIKIKYGSGIKPTRARYNFDKLKKIGDFFEVLGDKKHGSIRSQASKQAKIRGVRYAVTKTDSTPRLKRPGIVVRLESLSV